MSSFRPANGDHLDSVLELMRRYYAEDGYPFDRAKARLAASALIGESRFGRLWVAEVENRIAGYLAVTLGFSLEYRGQDAFIDELYVDAAFRGRGLGHDALETAERYCREAGVSALHLEVERHRTQTAELYRRAGFVDHERHLMTKRLSVD